jgi:hypothetical protein
MWLQAKLSTVIINMQCIVGNGSFVIDVLVSACVAIPLTAYVKELVGPKSIDLALRPPFTSGYLCSLLKPGDRFVSVIPAFL